MPKKPKNIEPDAPRPNSEWEYTTELQINGRNVAPGTELKIVGERGRFRFMRVVRKPDGKEWLDVWGGAKGSEQWRSFKLERVARVHYKNKTLGNLANEYKEKMITKKLEIKPVHGHD